MSHTSAIEARKLLGTEILVPVNADGSVPSVSTAGLSIVPVFLAADGVPDDLPPGCDALRSLLGHQIPGILPEDESFHLYIEPGEHIISAQELRRLSDELAATAASFLHGAADKEAVQTAFHQATVYCQARQEPGFLTYPGRTDAIPVFSSLNLLARSAGSTPWFSTTGQDILNLLPDGYVLTLDPDSPHALELDQAGIPKSGRF